MEKNKHKELKNNLIAVFESRTKDESILVRGASRFHSNFKVLVYDKYGKSLLAAEELKHQEHHYKLLKNTYKKKLQKEGKGHQAKSLANVLKNMTEMKF